MGIFGFFWCVDSILVCLVDFEFVCKGKYLNSRLFGLVFIFEVGHGLTFFIQGWVVYNNVKEYYRDGVVSMKMCLFDLCVHVGSYVENIL